MAFLPLILWLWHNWKSKLLVSNPKHKLLMSSQKATEDHSCRLNPIHFTMK